MKECLLSTAVDQVTPGFDIHSGLGMVDARAAANCAHALTEVQRAR